MEGYSINQYQSYSWHQSHDQATVLLLVPYETTEEDAVVVIEQNFLLAGVRGQPPVIKGRLYGNVGTCSSSWQLEPRTSRLSARERTTSTTSTASTQSSYAFVSDPEISSSFAASLESGQVSDAEELVATSPAYSSPISSSAEERDRGGFPFQRRRDALLPSQPVSPRNLPRSLTSSFSSLESLHSHHSGRLLTLHLEKEQPVIWPSLIVGPVPEALSPCAPGPLLYDTESEYKYNMDPNSLVLIALELSDIRRDKEEAFECFVRAWHQAHVPTATMRLVTNYLPLQASFRFTELDQPPKRGTVEYNLQVLGGPAGLAQLYLEAGLMHLEGAASTLLSSSYSTLSSIRLPPHPQPEETGTEAWRRDREIARRYFDRARALQPHLDVPYLPLESDEPLLGAAAEELEMPSIEIQPEEDVRHVDTEATLRRRRKKEELAVLGEVQEDGIDSSWYLYIPGLVGAGTALLVVGVVGALSFSTWRRNQGS